MRLLWQELEKEREEERIIWLKKKKDIDKSLTKSMSKYILKKVNKIERIEKDIVLPLNTIICHKRKDV